MVEERFKDSTRALESSLLLYTETADDWAIFAEA